MRFTNGTWDVKEGIKINAAVEVSKLTILEAQQSGGVFQNYLAIPSLHVHRR